MIGLLLLAEVAAKAPVAGPVEHLHGVVIDAIRNCPKGEDGEVIVCAPDRGIAEAYRIPKLDPRFADGALRPSGRGAAAAADAGVAATGTGSCSTVGASGSTGCSLAEANAWGAWKKQQQASGATWFPW